MYCNDGVSKTKTSERAEDGTYFVVQFFSNVFVVVLTVKDVAVMKKAFP